MLRRASAALSAPLGLLTPAAIAALRSPPALAVEQKRSSATARLPLPPLPPPVPPPPLLEPWQHSGAPIEAAATPPSSWYHSPDILRLEERSVFARSWLAVAHESALAAPGTYAAGELAGLQWVAVRDQGGVLRAFHNVRRRTCRCTAAKHLPVRSTGQQYATASHAQPSCPCPIHWQVCRHHAAILAPPGDGTLGDGCLRCPYHGWQYGLDGRLLKATRLKGIEGFRAADHGLAPLAAQAWGGFVWVRAAAAGGSSSDSLDSRSSSGGEQRQAAHQSVQHDRQQQQQQDVAAWLGPRGAAAALAAGIADALVHVASREYEIACNWKVFADNYLVGRSRGGRREGMQGRVDRNACQWHIRRAGGDAPHQCWRCAAPRPHYSVPLTAPAATVPGRTAGTM